MYSKRLVLLSAFALLSGCQPDSPPIQRSVATSAPVAAAPVVAPVAAEPAAKAAAPLPRELQLAQASRCLACHAIDAKLVGPAWKDVAAKYRGQKDAEAKLIAKVTQGGGGVWGSVPMPPNVQVSQADIKTLVRYILSLK